MNLLGERGPGGSRSLFLQLRQLVSGILHRLLSHTDVDLVHCLGVVSDRPLRVTGVTAAKLIRSAARRK
jgi:hypothetical protein